jgi:GT2 family glycosyltransferase
MQYQQYSTSEMLSNIVVVMVTYANRHHYVNKVTERLFTLGIEMVVLVDNASSVESQEVYKSLSQHYVEKLRYIKLDKNTGSAGGFSKGIEVAQQTNKPFILLLDDDNYPSNECLSQLLLTFTEHSNCCAVSLRPAFLSIWSGKVVASSLQKPDSFIGFDFRTLHQKIIRRAGFQKKPLIVNKDLIVPFAYYGGFIFHANDLLHVGLPKREMFLYGDDVEWTARFSNHGIPVYLSIKSELDELEDTAADLTHGSNSFTRKLNSKDLIKAYYAFRNGCYLYKSYKTGFGFIFITNVIIYMVLLLGVAIFSKKLGVYKVYWYAFLDGFTGRLGEISKEYLSGNSRF